MAKRDEVKSAKFRTDQANKFAPACTFENMADTLICHIQRKDIHPTLKGADADIPKKVAANDREANRKAQALAKKFRNQGWTVMVNSKTNVVATVKVSG